MGHLSRGQREALMNKALEIVKERPDISFKRLAEEVGLSSSSCQRWYADDIDGFKERYHEALRYAFNKLEGLAIRTLGDLLVDGNFQATKYVLDNRGYKAEDKTNLTVSGDMDIKINIEE